MVFGFSRRSDAKSEHAIGLSTLRANGIEGKPLVVYSFVTPEHRLPVADPAGDWYLNTAIVPTLRPGESALVTKLLPGLENYYHLMGLLRKGTELIQVEPNLGSNTRSPFGYAATDPLVLAERRHINGKYVLVSPFSTNTINSHARRLGIQTIGFPDSTLTNNKALIREKEIAEKYGIRTLPGFITYDYDDVKQAERKFSGTPHGIWMKLPVGSGGDYVMHLHDASKAEIYSGRNRIRHLLAEHFRREKFEGFEGFWPQNMFSPKDFPLIIETDVRNLVEPGIGKVINGSTQIITNTNGTAEVGMMSQQITTKEGIYIGNIPLIREYQINSHVKLLLEEEATKVGRYNIEVNGYHGIQGIDWFLVYNGKNIQYFLTELNSRPTIATIAWMVSEKLEADSWVITNAYTTKPMTSIDDFISLVGDKLASPTSIYDTKERIAGEGLVVPIAFRTLIGANGKTIPSTDMKIQVFGSDIGHCHRILNSLEEKGIIFTERRD